MKDLAIVIPAYKPDFLRECLISLVKQTNHNFKVYIGDDASPHNIRGIVDEFTTTLEIFYFRFETNLGSCNLTKQWERCIELSNEEWVWLFSDDDVVSSNCVEAFYLRNIGDSQFFKFKTKVIDEKGNIHDGFKKADQINNISESLSLEEFLEKRLLSNGFRSFAVEYIFSRALFNRIGFVDFPAAWNSDDASWLLYFSQNNYKVQIIDSVVYWRYSGLNISASVGSESVSLKKIEANRLFIKWLVDNFAIEKGAKKRTMLIRWFVFQNYYIKYRMSFRDFRNSLSPLKVNDIIIIYSFFKLQTLLSARALKNLFVR